MAAATLRADSAPANHVKDALQKFRIATCSPLNGTGEDGPNEILPMIYGLATLLDMGFRKPENGDAALENANPELVACAFDGIAQLAALALFRCDAGSGING
jgi:hypothetical protein